MRIWIDFINTPQVSFFEPLINELSSEGHEFILTCRDSANTVQLVKQKGWEHEVIGDRAEKSFFKKVFNFPVRIWYLRNFLRNKSVDVAICQSSFYLPIVARALGVPSLYTNDNEHAMGNIPAFYAADRILIPENLSLKKVSRQGARQHKTGVYPGIKEGVYLWSKGMQIIAERKKVPKHSQSVYIRPEPQTAQYYSGKLNFLDDIIVALSEKVSVVLLVRDKNQMAHYSQDKFSKVSVPTEPIPFDTVAKSCLLFIGAGGSMTREMSMIGIPTISVYQGELLDVDRFLIDEGYLVHNPNLDLDFIDGMIAQRPVGESRTELIEKGKEAYELFKTELFKLS